MHGVKVRQRKGLRCLLGLVLDVGKRGEKMVHVGIAERKKRIKKTEAVTDSVIKETTKAK